MNSILEKYPQEVAQILAKYPVDQKRSAVMPLIYLAQSERGYVSPQQMVEIGQIIELSSTDVASIVGFYTLYHSQPEGYHKVQVCTDLPCALRGAEVFLEKLCENIGIQVGQTTPDGKVKVEAVMCLAGCDKAPMFQVQSGSALKYYENQTVESAAALIEQLRKDEV